MANVADLLIAGAARLFSGDELTPPARVRLSLDLRAVLRVHPDAAENGFLELHLDDVSTVAGVLARRGSPAPRRILVTGKIGGVARMLQLGWEAAEEPWCKEWLRALRGMTLMLRHHSLGRLDKVKDEVLRAMLVPVSERLRLSSVEHDEEDEEEEEEETGGFDEEGVLAPEAPESLPGTPPLSVEVPSLSAVESGHDDKEGRDSFTYSYTPRAMRMSDKSLDGGKRELAMNQDFVGDIVRAGFLLKKGQLNKAFKKRWIILRRNGRLEYYADAVRTPRSAPSSSSPHDKKRPKAFSFFEDHHTAPAARETGETATPLGSFSIVNAVLGAESEGLTDLVLETQERRWVFRCQNVRERHRWVDSIVGLNLLRMERREEKAAPNVTRPSMMRRWRFASLLPRRRNAHLAESSYERHMRSRSPSPEPASLKHMAESSMDSQDLRSSLASMELSERPRRRGSSASLHNVYLSARILAGADRPPAGNPSRKSRGPSQRAVVKVLQDLQISNHRRASLQLRAAHVVARPPVLRAEGQSAELSSAPGTAFQGDRVRVGILTWNMNARLPQPADLRFLKAVKDCHLIVIGVQESQPASILATDTNGQYTLWQEMLVGALGKNFVPIVSRLLGALHLIAFTTENCLPLISGVTAGVLPCGVGNLGVNKGAVGVSLRLKGRHVAFVTAHLAAGPRKVRERNGNLERIFRYLPDQMLPLWAGGANGHGHAEVKVMGDKFSMDLEQAEQAVGTNKRLESEWNVAKSNATQERKKRTRRLSFSERIMKGHIDFGHPRHVHAEDAIEGEGVNGAGPPAALEAPAEHRPVRSVHDAKVEQIMGIYANQDKARPSDPLDSGGSAPNSVGLTGAGRRGQGTRPLSPTGPTRRMSHGEILLREGSLAKRPRNALGLPIALGRWNSRWFVLTPTRLAFAILDEGSTGGPRGKPSIRQMRGTFELNEATTCDEVAEKEVGGREHVFRLADKRMLLGEDRHRDRHWREEQDAFAEVRPLFLQASSEDDRQQWIRSVCGAIASLQEGGHQPFLESSHPPFLESSAMPVAPPLSVVPTRAPDPAPAAAPLSGPKTTMMPPPPPAPPRPESPALTPRRLARAARAARKPSTGDSVDADDGDEELAFLTDALAGAETDMSFGSIVSDRRAKMKRSALSGESFERAILSQDLGSASSLATPRGRRTAPSASSISHAPSFGSAHLHKDDSDSLRVDGPRLALATANTPVPSQDATAEGEPEFGEEAPRRTLPAEAFAKRFDAAFFFGDLNYRIEVEKGVTEAVVALGTMIESTNEEEVLESFGECWSDDDADADGDGTSESGARGVPRSPVSASSQAFYLNEDLVSRLSRAAAATNPPAPPTPHQLPHRTPVRRSHPLAVRETVGASADFFSTFAERKTPDEQQDRDGEDFEADAGLRRLQADLARYKDFRYEGYGRSAIGALAAPDEDITPASQPDPSPAQRTFRPRLRGLGGHRVHSVESDASPKGELRRRSPSPPDNEPSPASTATQAMVAEERGPWSRSDVGKTPPGTRVDNSSFQSEGEWTAVAPARVGHTIPDDLRFALSQEILELTSRAVDAHHRGDSIVSPADLLEVLLQFDQLRAQRLLGRAFQGWEEGVVTFPPSYKYDPFTTQLDTSKKARVPSWTDRILYTQREIARATSSEAEGPLVELLGYASVKQAFHSDHRPVVGRFTIRL